jgi:membrane associated rhomboid family serine protease
MSKVWTRRRAEAARAARRARKQEAARKAARWAHLRREGLQALAVAAATTAVLLGVVAIQSGPPTPMLVASAALIGVAGAGGRSLHRWVRPRLGRLTSLALISLLLAGVLYAASTLGCGASATSCTTGTSAGVATTALLLPFMVALVCGAPVAAARFAHRTGRAAWAWVSQRRD